MAAAAAAAKTASTYRAAFVHGSHLFDIGAYSALKALGGSVNVTSGSFRVAGHDWNILCRFEGRLTHITLELAAAANLGSSSSVKATVRFSVDDPTGGCRPMKMGRHVEDEDTLVFTQNSARFYTVDVPEAASQKLEARYVKYDGLRIRVAVRVLNVEESGPTRYCFVDAPPPPNITRFLRVLLDSGQRADVTFAVDGSCRFDAHRLVLAMRSPVFSSKFFGGSKDSSLEWFRVHDVSAHVFRAMLHFIYTDELPQAEEASSMARDLLVAADLYGLDRLRLLCERTLWDRVRQTDGGGGVGTAISTLSLLNGRDSCGQLQDLCIGYVADHWDAATATEEYRELKSTCPALLTDVLEHFITKQLLHLHGTDGDGRLPPSPSASASVYRASEVWRGTHQLTVLGHSVVRRTHGKGELIRSGVFEVGGHEWRILYCPSSEQVLLQLQVATTPLLDPNVVLEASGTIAIIVVDDAPAEGDEGFCSSMMADFCHRYTNAEPAKGCRKLSISSLVGPDDILTLECSFEFKVVAAGNKATTTTAARARLLPQQEQDVVVPPPNISWHLERLLESGMGSDVTFSVEDGGEFHAHTLVLNERAPALLVPVLVSKKAAAAAAEAVSQQSKKKKKEKKKRKICIEGIKPVVFKALLYFAYTDELPPLDDLVRAAGAGNPTTLSSASSRTWMAGDLLAAAERYQMVERMRPLCENLLCEAIVPENAAATLELARRHGCPELRAFCLDYMTSPGVFKAVVASDGCQALPADALRDIVTHLAH